MRFVAALCFVTVVSGTAAAQELTATPIGEITLRYRHFEGHDFAPGGVDDFVRQRARLGLRFAYGDELQALVQVQDVRTWGDETDTLGDFSADGFDLHQGYLEVALDPDLRLRLGRQEINFLNQRLVGSVNFVEQGRSFDAARVMARAFDQQLSIDLFYARTSENLPADSQAADDVFGYNFRLQFGDYLQTALVGVIDLNSNTDRVRSTSGVFAQTDLPFGLRFALEGYLQAGSATIANVDRSFLAWMFATRLRFTLVDLDEFKPFLEAFVETLSGDDEPGNAHITTFDTLFATNHRFYGEADFFLNIPRDTRERGLLDTGVVLGTSLGADASAQLALHFFQAMASQGGEGSFGQEIDLTFAWKVNPHFALDLNYSVFLPGAAFSADGDPEHFVYSTASATF